MFLCKDCGRGLSVQGEFRPLGRCEKCGKQNAACTDVSNVQVIALTVCLACLKKLAIYLPAERLKGTELHSCSICKSAEAVDCVTYYLR